MTTTQDAPEDHREPFWWRRSTELAFAIASPVALLIVWEVASRFGLVDARIVPPPSVVVVTIGEMIAQGGLVADSAATIARFIVGLLIGSVPGLLLGLSMGLFRPAQLILNPLVAAIYPVPRIALFPLILILMGLNETSNIIMIALGPFFTMLITAQSASQSVDRIYTDVARNFGTSTWDTYRLVMIPAIMPVLMGGFRVSLGLALLGTVAAEFLIGQSGLGYVIWNSWQILSLKQSMAGLVVTAAIGAVFYVSLDWLERWLVPWAPQGR